MSAPHPEAYHKMGDQTFVLFVLKKNESDFFDRCVESLKKSVGYSGNRWHKQTKLSKAQLLK